MMQTTHSILQLRERLHLWRSKGERISFVPTMGNIHEGHLALVKKARELGDRVIVSIFVNPLQFAPHEDFASYPRTFKEDQLKLADAGVDLLFAPHAAELFPNQAEFNTHVEIPHLSKQYCGITRPHFFGGVATIVTILFNLIHPHVAIFGEKDYQQLTVIRQMVRDLHIPIEIVSVPIIREQDGLALSSRNRYLTTDERKQAPLLYQTLCTLSDAVKGVQQGSRQDQEIDYHSHIQTSLETATQTLTQAGFKVDYLSLCRYPDLTTFDNPTTNAIILAAAYLGKTRLIDNRVVI